MPTLQSRDRMPKPIKALSKPRSLILTLGGAALLVVGGGAAFWFLQLQQGGNALPTGATLIPKDVALSLTLSTDFGKWKQLDQFGTTESQKRWLEGVANLEETVLNDNGLTYAEHVRPWIGDQVTMALLPPTIESVEQVDQEATIWILPVRNLQQARQLLINQLATSSNQATQRTHKGINIQEFKANDQKNYGIALIDERFLVFTNAGVPMDHVIDTFKNQSSIATLPRFPLAMQKIRASGAVAQVYVNLPIAAKRLNTNRQFASETIEQIQSTQGLGATVSLTSDGVNIKAVSWLNPQAKDTLNLDNQGGDILKHLPADTLMVASGGNFRQFWTDYAKGTPSKLIVPFNPKQWNDTLKESLEIDFNNDFVSWMESEFASALIPAGGEDNDDVGFVFMAKTADRAAATVALQRLDNAVRDRFNFQVAESQVGKKSIITWKVPPGLPIASHGWLTNDVAFMTFGTPIADRLLPPPEPSLLASQLFQTATQSQLTPNNGHFFVEMSSALGFIQTSPLLPKLSSQALNFAKEIDAIGVTAAASNEWSSRYDIHVKLKRN